jgi:hypothetical protein
MKKSDASQGQSASELSSKRIADLGDWRGETLSRMRKLIKEADPDVVEEWKWIGTNCADVPCCIRSASFRWNAVLAPS